MSKPFDAATKLLLEEYPGPWLAYLGLRAAGDVRVINADLATVAAEADKVYRVDGPDAHLVHVEMQANPDPSLPRRMLRYNALLDLRHDLRVRSVVVLLRPAADAERLSGLLELDLPDGDPVARFHYRVVRAWRQPVEPILAGPIGTLPMAPVADVPDSGVRDVIRRIDDRLAAETDPARSVTIMQATFLLAGLRFPGDVLLDLFEGNRTMDLFRESSAYGVMLREGRIDEARRIIGSLGRKRFGPPSEEIRAALEGIKDLDRLEALTDRILGASSWEELLAGA